MVFVISADRKPLDMCHEARARVLLDKGKAVVWRIYPFTILLKNSWSFGANTSEYRLKIDPGSKYAGLAILREDNGQVVWAAELKHRGSLIKKGLESRRHNRRNRRTRKLRYRKPRFDNRVRAKCSRCGINNTPRSWKIKTLKNGKTARIQTGRASLCNVCQGKKGDPNRKSGWLAPSVMHRPLTVHTWINRLIKFCPIGYISIEDCKFDTQKFDNPDIQGEEYQRGEMEGYEIREYLLEKYDRKCVFCKQESRIPNVEHNIPKSKGGTDRLSNLVLACKRCNDEKGTMTGVEYFEVLLKREEKKRKKGGKKPMTDDEKKKFSMKAAIKPTFMKDVAATNSIRKRLVEFAWQTGLSVETGTGGLTKYNRHKLQLEKAHWLDAACVGTQRLPDPESTEKIKPLLIECKGQGTRQKVSVYGPYKRVMEFEVRTRDGREAVYKPNELVAVDLLGETINGKVLGTTKPVAKKKGEKKVAWTRIALEDGKLLRVNEHRDIGEVVPKAKKGFPAVAPGMPAAKPKAGSELFGFRSGDFVWAETKAGRKLARIAGVRVSGSFTVITSKKEKYSVSYKKCKIVQRKDGYSYRAKGVDR